jgi:hypothetical protein
MTIHQRRDDYPNPWRIQVRGHPARREGVSWREAIRDATNPQAPFTSLLLGTRFTVEVIFRMTPEDLARPAFDLDNFAKPVLDTLSVRSGQEDTGAGERSWMFPEGLPIGPLLAPGHALDGWPLPAD